MPKKYLRQMYMKKTARPRRRPARKTGYKSKLANSEFASLKETYEFATLNSVTAYRDMTISLARFVRASAVASGYQEYRMTKVEYKWKPLTDTFAPAGTPVPYMYILIDRTGANSAITSENQFVAAGCKALRLDDKIINRSFKPAVLNYALDAVQSTNLYAKPMISPWLSTNANNTLTASGWSPSSTDHLGLEWFVSADPSLRYKVEMTVHFQFRKPAVAKTAPTDASAVTVEAAEVKVVVEEPQV